MNAIERPSTPEQRPSATAAAAAIAVGDPTEPECDCPEFCRLDHAN